MYFQFLHHFSDNFNSEELEVFLENCFEETKAKLLKDYNIRYENYPKAKLSIKSGQINDDYINSQETYIFRINLLGK